MKGKQNTPLTGIVLVSTPWPLFSRPSIQVGTLKAYLGARFPGLKVEAHHFYLKVAETIGYKLYQAISERTWPAEAVYAALMFPERATQIEKVFRGEAAGKPIVRQADFRAATTAVKRVSDAFVDHVDWGAFGLAGFSVSICQMTSALYIIRRLKEKAPTLPIVVGGSLIAGDSAMDLLEAFPGIDCAITGEGELPLSRLVGHLQAGNDIADLPPTPGIVTRTSAGNSTAARVSQLETLDDLVLPDYDDYFSLLRTFDSQERFFPTLPIEISRGCWWRHQKRAVKSAKYAGCAFCNLNLQWDGYRSKDPAKVVSEVDRLTSRHKTLSVALMDNLLPVKDSGRIFDGLAGLKKDLSLFGEIRASTPKRVLNAMQAAGFREVQIGIEALSTSLLKKLNKGTTAIQNLEIMKHCEELGIASVSNLILYFPGSDDRDVAETMRCLKFALPFRPLRFVHFWLGLGSPVWQAPHAFGIRAVFNHPNYAAIFPSGILGPMRLMIQAYRGDLGRQRRIWRPVKDAVRDWKKIYDRLHKGRFAGPILSFRDGLDFLIISQRQLHAESMTHRLVGASREIYLFCQTHRTLKRIVDRFPGIGEERILPFLRMMTAKRLMFEEDGKYLSLAVPVRPADRS